MTTPPRLLTLRADALPGYEACLRDMLDLLDRVAAQPAIAHAPALRVVLQDRAAMLPALGDMRHAAREPAPMVVPAAAWTPGLETAVREWKAQLAAPAQHTPVPALDDVWTPARDAALLEWGATPQHGGVLLDVVNALPGQRLRSEHLVLRRLARLREGRPAGLDVPPPCRPPAAPVAPPADDAAAEAAQEGLADAVAHAALPAPPAPPAKRRAHPNQLHAAPKWTPARLALVHEKAGKILGRDLLKLLNALPGPPIASTGAMRVKLRDLGLAATPGLPPLPADFDPRDMDEAAREAVRKRARLLAVAAGMGDWTEARLALLHADYATAPTLPELLTRINALPGNPIASTESMRRKAETLGLRRANPGASPEHMARMNAARSAQAAQRRAAQQAAPPPAAEPRRDHFPDATKMVPTPEAALDTPATIKPALNVPPAAPARSTQRVTTPWIKEAMDGKRPIAPVAATLDAWASPGVLTPEAEADAQRMLADGQGAKAMHEEFGGRLEWWQSWTARHRQAGRAA